MMRQSSGVYGESFTQQQSKIALIIGFFEASNLRNVVRVG